MNLDFAWHSRKAESNIEKHGIGFHDAAAMMSKKAHFAYPHQRPGDDEMRWRAIGPIPEDRCPEHWSGLLIVVVFTKRGESTYRIISARRASKDERRNYKDQLVRSGPP
jgi:hypothetical protein